MGLLDYLFPKRCVQCKKIGWYLCAKCFSYISFIDHMVCAVCQKETFDGMTHPICQTKYGIDGVFSSLAYKGVVKKLIHTFKYPPYITDLQKLLTDLFYEGMVEKEALYVLLEEPAILIPIPLHSGKYRKRGYNQARLLADGLAPKVQYIVIDCLVRERNTKTQVGLTKEERQKNIQGAFSVKNEFLRILIQTPQVFLIDDVATSGATLREAAKVLKQVGVKNVWGLTLAHGE